MSLRLPICEECRHYIENPTLGKMCCKAFPDGIPLEYLRLYDDGKECNDGIKYEKETTSQK